MSASPSEAQRDLARVTTDKFAAVGYRHDPYNAQMPWYLTVPTHVSVFDKINFAYATGAGVIGCRLQDLPDMMLIRKVPSQYAKARAPWKQPGYVRPPDAELCDLFIGALPYGHCPYVVGKLFADAVGAHVHDAEEIPDKHPQGNGSNNKSTSCRLTVRITDRDACLALSLTSIITGGGLLMVSPAANSRSVAVKHFGDQLRRRDELIEGSRPNASRRKGLRPMVVQNTASTARRAGAGVSDYAHSGGPNS